MIVQCCLLNNLLQHMLLQSFLCLCVFFAYHPVRSHSAVPTSPLHTLHLSGHFGCEHMSAATPRAPTEQHYCNAENGRQRFACNHATSNCVWLWWKVICCHQSQQQHTQTEKKKRTRVCTCNIYANEESVCSFSMRQEVDRNIGNTHTHTRKTAVAAKSSADAYVIWRSANRVRHNRVE